MIKEVLFYSAMVYIVFDICAFVYKYFLSEPKKHTIIRNIRNHGNIYSETDGLLQVCDDCDKHAVFHRETWEINFTLETISNFKQNKCEIHAQE